MLWMSSFFGLSHVRDGPIIGLYVTGEAEEDARFPHARSTMMCSRPACQ
jgi:hypothetical protein